MRTWLIITPELPPDSGGIGDYTALVAGELAARGDRVTVFTCSPPGRTSIPGVEIARIPDEFGRGTERLLASALADAPRDAVTLVQYVPQGFRLRGMNVPFCAWLGARKERRFVMVHEALYPLMKGDATHRLLLAAATRLMLRLLVRSAERVFVSTPAWESALERWGGSAPSVEWLPIPATLAADPERLLDGANEPARARPELAHFGTYGGFITSLLDPTLQAAVERRPELELRLLGRGATEYARRFVTRVPAAAGRIAFAGPEPAAVARALSFADAVVLPFGEGVTSRRTSFMNALAVGAAIVTTEGVLSERVWRESAAVSLYPYDRPEHAVRAVERLLDDASFRATQKARARALYRERFRLGHVVDRLRALYDARDPAGARFAGAALLG